MRMLKYMCAVMVVVLSMLTTNAVAQNIQLHYDFGRNMATTTVEMFKHDGGGSTYFFVDMDYNRLKHKNTNNNA